MLRSLGLFFVCHRHSKSQLFHEFFVTQVPVFIAPIHQFFIPIPWLELLAVPLRENILQVFSFCPAAAVRYEPPPPATENEFSLGSQGVSFAIRAGGLAAYRANLRCHVKDVRVIRVGLLAEFRRS